MFENDFGLEGSGMTVETINVKGNTGKVLEKHHERLKAEAGNDVDASS